MYPCRMLPFACRVLVLGFAVTTLVSCSSTQVTTLWQDPTVEQIRFSKVLSLWIVKDAELRDAAEGELCRHIASVECKAAYFAIPDSMITDVEAAKALTLKEGFDGAVVVRVLAAGEREGKHVVMTDGQRILTIPRHNPVNAFTMGGIVRDAGLSVEDFKKLL